MFLLAPLRIEGEMRHLDLFSGMGGFSLGLKQAGFNITHTQFSEIDKYAISVYQKQFAEAEYVGSVTDVRGVRGQADIITFGSPCQDFSLAGKRKGMEGNRSSLISEAIRLISEIRPEFFIWENVKGTFSSNDGADFWGIIKAFTNIGGYRLEWQLLNTSWFLPQNRERIYLVGCLGEGSGRSIFPIGEGPGETDIGIEVVGNTNNSGRGERSVVHGTQGNMSCLTSTDYKQPKQVMVGTWRTHKDGEGFREVDNNLCPTIPARAREDGSGQPVIRVPEPTSKGYAEAGVAQTLDTACNQGIIDSYNNKEVDIVGTLRGATGEPSCGFPVKEHSRIRRLTPIECERLQGFEDNWTAIGKDGEKISDTQRYKLCGNAVSVPVVKAVGEAILRSEETP